MITVPKKVEYSVAFLVYLVGARGKIRSLTEVSRDLQLPYRFLGQIAMDLKGAGIVDSREGKTGGYSLNLDWEKKSLYDLLEALGENKRLVKCLQPDVDCPREAECQMKRLWGRVENSFVNELKKVKLKDIRK